jgi:hypothetical protein
MPSSPVEPHTTQKWHGVPLVGALACVLLAGCAPHQAGGTASAPHPASSQGHDWRTTTYRLTCDGLLHGKVRATLVDGAAQVPVEVSQTPAYDHVDVLLEGTTSGDVDGDGAPDTAVLLRCWPQPSNGFVEEVHVFRSDGSELGVLPSPSTLPEATILAPLYDPAGLSVQRGEVVAPMKAYGPDDSHATGPSVPFTVRWHWNGTGFVRVP